MQSVACLLVLALLDVDPLLAPLEPADELPAPRPGVSRWLPRVTLRFTHRGVRSFWAETQREALSVPWGSTFEVRLEWGAATDTTVEEP